MEMLSNAVFCTGNLKARDHLKNLDLDGRIISRCISKMDDVREWAGFVSLKVGTSG
jgi:hypothetical protein